MRNSLAFWHRTQFMATSFAALCLLALGGCGGDEPEVVADSGAGHAAPAASGGGAAPTGAGHGGPAASSGGPATSGGGDAASSGGPAASSGGTAAGHGSSDGGNSGGSSSASPLQRGGPASAGAGPGGAGHGGASSGGPGAAGHGGGGGAAGAAALRRGGPAGVSSGGGPGGAGHGAGNGLLGGLGANSGGSTDLGGEMGIGGGSGDSPEIGPGDLLSNFDAGRLADALSGVSEESESAFPREYGEQAKLAYQQGYEKLSYDLMLAHLATEPEAAATAYEQVMLSRDLKRPAWHLRFGMAIWVRTPEGYTGGLEPITSSTGGGGGGGGGGGPSFEGGMSGGASLGGKGGARNGQGGNQAAQAPIGGRDSVADIEQSLGLFAEVTASMFSTRFSNGDYGMWLATSSPSSLPAGGGRPAGAGGGMAGGPGMSGPGMAGPGRRGPAGAGAGAGMSAPGGGNAGPGMSAPGLPGLPGQSGPGGAGHDSGGPGAGAPAAGGPAASGPGGAGHGAGGAGGGPGGAMLGGLSSGGEGEGSGGFGGGGFGSGQMAAAGPIGFSAKSPAKPRWVPGIVYLGRREIRAAIAEAREAGLDYLILFEVKIDQRRDDVENTTRARLLNLQRADSLAEAMVGATKRLSSLDVANRNRSGNVDVREIVSGAVSPMFEAMDRTVKLTGLPALNEEQARGRVAQLLSSDEPDVRILSEVQLYRHMGLLSDEDLLVASDMLLGDDGIRLIAGTEKVRRDAAEALQEPLTSYAEIGLGDPRGGGFAGGGGGGPGMGGPGMGAPGMGGPGGMQSDGGGGAAAPPLAPLSGQGGGPAGNQGGNGGVGAPALPPIN